MLCYTNYFTKYKKFIKRLPKDNAQNFKKVQDIIKDCTVVNELIFISTHLVFLLIVVKKQETQNVPLRESFSIIDEIKKI